MNDFDYDTEMPNKLEAERAVIGAVLLQPESYDIIAGRIKPADFYLPRHQMIYRSIESAAASGDKWTIFDVGERLRASGKLDECGGLAYLSEMIEGQGSAETIEYAAALVRKNSDLRKIYLKALAMKAESTKPLADPELIITETAEHLLNIGTVADKSEAVSVADLMPGIIKTMAAKERGEVPQGLMTGFDAFDRCSSGLNPGNYVVVAGRPSLGKTALALQMMRQMAGDGKRTLFFSLEMTKEMCGQRLLSLESNTNLTSILTGSGANGKSVMVAQSRLVDLQDLMIIDDYSGHTVQTMQARARRIHAKTSLDCIIVDYLQLIKEASHTRRSATKEEVVADKSAGILRMAKELQVPVIVLCQLNRSIEYRKGRKPVLADLRESGAIEQDAHIVSILSNENEDERKKETLRVPWHILKNRNGPTREIALVFRKSRQHFGEAASPHEEADEPMPPAETPWQDREGYEG